jgi:hypothetical protein
MSRRLEHTYVKKKHHHAEVCRYQSLTEVDD